MVDENLGTYCEQCGNPIQEGDRFCGVCGARVAPVTTEDPQVIPRPAAAAQNAPPRNRTFLVAGVVSVALLLLVGGGALAFVSLGSGTGLLGGADPEPVPTADTGESTTPPPEATREPTTASTTSSEPSWMSSEEIASLKEFGREYDAADMSEDWEATYEMLDESAQREFTEEEWVEIQQARRGAEGSPALLESVTVTQEDEEMTDVPVTVTLHYEGGAEEAMTAGMPMAVEAGADVGPRRYLTEEEITELEQLLPPGSTSPDTGDLEAEVEDAAEKYYLAVHDEDFAYTYEHLDSRTQEMFTQEEWFQKNQWMAENYPAVLSSLEVEADVSSSGDFASVTVFRTYEDGSSASRDTYFVLEDGEWLHRFGQEEIELFMPDVPFEEFVAARQ